MIKPSKEQLQEAKEWFTSKINWYESILNEDHYDVEANTNSKHFTVAKQAIQNLIDEECKPKPKPYKTTSIKQDDGITSQSPQGDN